MSYPKQTKPALVKELRQRNLKVSGLKQELIDRLVKDDELRDSTKLPTAAGDLVSQSNGSTHYSPSNSMSYSVGNSSGAPSNMPMHRQKKGSLSLPRTGSQYQLWHLTKESEKEDRQKITLFRSPVTTTYYFVRESLYLLLDLVHYILAHKKTLVLGLLMTAILTVLFHLDGSHQPLLMEIKKTGLWWLWWVGLGFLSSCGLGTGLHTFLLYLGPFIAKVTLAAYECKSTKFPSPPYPDDIVCPTGDYVHQEIGMFSIVRKVQLEAVLWGIGTAIGELPPFFMARAARLSGDDPDDEEFDEFEELLHVDKPKKDLPLHKRAEILVRDLIMKVGFPGIVACASIPNPLFDLAGMTCGHFLVPFWTFFGATCIGKAVIKMHIQQLFVIAVFSEHHVESILHFIKYIPLYGKKLQSPFKEYLKQQKLKLHHGKADANQSWIQFLTAGIVWAMVIYFVVSIVTALAQNYHRRLCKAEREQNELDVKND